MSLDKAFFNELCCLGERVTPLIEIAATVVKLPGARPKLISCSGEFKYDGLNCLVDVFVKLEI